MFLFQIQSSKEKFLTQHVSLILKDKILNAEGMTPGIPFLLHCPRQCLKADYSVYLKLSISSISVCPNSRHLTLR